MDFWRSFGVVTQSLLLEKAWKIVKDGRRKREALLKPPLFPSLLDEGRILGFVFCFLHVLIILVLAHCVVLLFVACLYVGLIWRVSFVLFLMFSCLS